MKNKFLFIFKIKLQKRHGTVLSFVPTDFRQNSPHYKYFSRLYFFVFDGGLVFTKQIL